MFSYFDFPKLKNVLKKKMCVFFQIIFFEFCDSYNLLKFHLE